MRMTYREALDRILEYTTIGYTQKSQDKIWLLVAIDDDTTPGRSFPAGYGNLVFLLDERVHPGPTMSYEIDDDVVVFTTKREAQAYLDGMPEPYGLNWMTFNLGDYNRYEQYMISVAWTLHTKFAGSKEVIERLTVVRKAEPEGFGLKASSVR